MAPISPRSVPRSITAGRVGLLACLLAASAGCRNIERFDTKNGGAYCGAMVQASLFQDGLLPDHVPPSLRVRLKLDTSSLAYRPGVLSSADSAKGTGLCSDMGQPLFQNAPLR